MKYLENFFLKTKAYYAQTSIKKLEQIKKRVVSISIWDLTKLIVQSASTPESNVDEQTKVHPADQTIPKVPQC